MSEPRLYIITGAMAAGKSTVAEALARTFGRAVHLRGDVFRRMIVAGQARMGPSLDPEARAQLSLRHNLACSVAATYVSAGFNVVYQDILLGDDLATVVNQLRGFAPRVIVLNPSEDVLLERDRTRHKHSYGEEFPPQVLAHALNFDTPRLGLWIDSSRMSVDEVVDQIRSHDWSDRASSANADD